MNGKFYRQIKEDINFEMKKYQINLLRKKDDECFFLLSNHLPNVSGAETLLRVDFHLLHNEKKSLAKRKRCIFMGFTESSKKKVEKLSFRSRK